MELPPPFKFVNVEGCSMYVCLMCTSEYYEDRNIDNNQRRLNLKTLCESLQVFNLEGTIQKLDDQNSEVNFCNACQLNLDKFRTIQDQLIELNLQIQELRGIISKALLQDSKPGASGTALSELRNSILYAKEYQSEIKEKVELITGDVENAYTETQDTQIPTAVNKDQDEFDHESYEEIDYCEIDHHWTPPQTKSKVLCSSWGKRQKARNARLRKLTASLSSTILLQTQRLTKPCEVRVTRLDDGGQSEIDSKQMRRERRKRLRQLVENRKIRNSSSGIRRSITRQKVSSAPKHDRLMKTKVKRIYKPRIYKRRAKVMEKCKLPCPFPSCPERYNTEAYLEYHIRKVHEGREKPFNCIACDSEFEKHKELLGHFTEAHGSGETTFAFACPTCKKQFKSTQNFRSHFRRQGGFCSKEPLPLNSTVDRSSQDDKKFTCGGCGQRFRTRYLLNIHVIAAHSEGHPFLCEFCCKPFKYAVSLESHQRQSHPKEYMESRNIDEEAFQQDFKERHCDICNKTFSSAKIKKTHNWTHTQEFPFRCDVCGLGCRSQSGLNKHKVVHTDERNFICEHCPIRFRREGGLKRHLETIHLIGGRTKSLSCEFCSKMFWDETARQRHKVLMHREQLPRDQTPLEYSCDLCGYICHDKGYLRIHQKSRRHKEKEAAEVKSKQQHK